MAQAEALAPLRVALLTLASVAGWWLKFAWTADSAVFDAGRAAIKDLPLPDRRWDDAKRMWWVSAAGCGDYPVHHLQPSRSAGWHCSS